MYIDKDSVVNKTSLDLINKVAICNICTGIIYNPVQCQECDNCFCKVCIDDWFCKSKSCPFKCGSNSFKDSRLAKSILSDLVIKCPLGCPKEIDYGKIEFHLNECEKNYVNCYNCNSKVPKSMISDKYLKALKDENEELKKQIEILKKENDFLKTTNKLNEGISNINKSENNNLKSTPYHEHSLKMTSWNNKNLKAYINGWICNICRNKFNKTVDNFYCRVCNFDLCELCVKKK